MSPFIEKSSPFVKRSQNRYNLTEFMNSKQGVLNSAAKITGGRLDAENLQRLTGAIPQDVTPDAKSIRSKRSLSINVNKVSKIIKMNDDGVSAISKVKQGDLGALRHKSTQRAISRGREAMNNTFAPKKLSIVETAAYKNQSNSQEDLQSHISRASFVKELYQKNF